MNNLCCLNLVFAENLEDTVSAVLIEHSPPLPGFTLLKAEGHSSDFGHASTRERVRGRVRRCVVRMVLPPPLVDEVIGWLRERLRSEHLVWWTERIENFGRLG